VACAFDQSWNSARPRAELGHEFVVGPCFAPPSAVKVCRLPGVPELAYEVAGCPPDDPRTQARKPFLRLTWHGFGAGLSDLYRSLRWRRATSKHESTRAAAGISGSILPRTHVAGLVEQSSSGIWPYQVMDSERGRHRERPFGGSMRRRSR